jgi:hypothetical protein
MPAKSEILNVLGHLLPHVVGWMAATALTLGATAAAGVVFWLSRRRQLPPQASIAGGGVRP